MEVGRERRDRMESPPPWLLTPEELSSSSRGLSAGGREVGGGGRRRRGGMGMRRTEFWRLKYCLRGGRLGDVSSEEEPSSLRLSRSWCGEAGREDCNSSFTSSTLSDRPTSVPSSSTSERITLICNFLRSSLDVQSLCSFAGLTARASRYIALQSHIYDSCLFLWLGLCSGVFLLNIPQVEPRPGL